MNITHLGTLFVLLFLVTACGNSGVNGRKKITLTQVDIASLLQRQHFECSSLDGKECPIGIARLFIHNPAKEEESGTCSGFLNSSNRIVTNNHCVANAQECSNTYITIYNGTAYEAVRCKKILHTKVDAGPLNSKGVDYSVLEIDRNVVVSHLPLATELPQIGENLSAWVIDHKSIFEARITELNCVYASKGNSLQLSYCPVIQGNSGSPLLNVYGEVVGVIWGSTVSDEVNANFPIEERRQLDDYAFATELRHFRPYLYQKI